MVTKRRKKTARLLPISCRCYAMWSLEECVCVCMCIACSWNRKKASERKSKPYEALVLRLTVSLSWITFRAHQTISILRMCTWAYVCEESIAVYDCDRLRIYVKNDTAMKKNLLYHSTNTTDASGFMKYSKNAIPSTLFVETMNLSWKLHTFRRLLIALKSKSPKRILSARQSVYFLKCFEQHAQSWTLATESQQNETNKCLKWLKFERMKRATEREVKKASSVRKCVCVYEAGMYSSRLTSCWLVVSRVIVCVGLRFSGFYFTYCRSHHRGRKRSTNSAECPSCR